MSATAPPCYGVLELMLKKNTAYPMAWGFETDTEARAFALLLNDMEAMVDPKHAETVEYVPHGRPGTRVFSLRGGDNRDRSADSPPSLFEIPRDFEPGTDRSRLTELNFMFSDEYIPRRKRRDATRAEAEARYFQQHFAALMARPPSEEVTVDTAVHLLPVPS